jgi:hypothetical protein
MNLKDIIKENKVYFHFYRANVMYYKVLYMETWYQFPVPLEDIGGATLLSEDKALIFMRYIRKAIESNEFVKAS